MQSFASSRGEVTEGMSGVCRGSLDLQQGGFFREIYSNCSLVLLMLPNYNYYFSRNSRHLRKLLSFDLIQPPDVAVLVLLVFALDDLHLILHRLLVEDGADQVGDEPQTFKIFLHFNGNKQSLIHPFCIQKVRK